MRNAQQTIAGSNPRPASRRAGFSLVELIVVIAIIALLATIVTVGISTTLSGMRERATTTQLDTLQTLVANFATADQSAGGTAVKKLPSVLQSQTGGTTFYSTLDARSDATADLTGATAAAGDPISAPTDASRDNGGTLEQMGRTQAVMRRLLTVPANKSLFDSLPDDTKTGGVAEGPFLSYVTGSGPRALSTPLMVDGFGNLFMYVPVSGLTDVSFRDGTTVSTTNATTGQGLRILAANGEPFWASAGADGNFATGDDNVYSTQVTIERVP